MRKFDINNPITFKEVEEFLDKIRKEDDSDFGEQMMMGRFFIHSPEFQKILEEEFKEPPIIKKHD